MLSALMMTEGTCFASLIAATDLPNAVGPAITNIFFDERPIFNMKTLGPNKVITLISPVKRRKLKALDIDNISEALLATGIEIIGHKWLSMSEACDLFFTRGTIEEAKKVLQRNLAG